MAWLRSSIIQLIERLNHARHCIDIQKQNPFFFVAAEF